MSVVGSHYKKTNEVTHAGARMCVKVGTNFTDKRRSLVGIVCWWTQAT
jgi:hypothetical protein